MSRQNSFVREHFKKDGKAKKTYYFADEAKRAEKGTNQRSYKCSFCGKYHLATEKKLKRY